MLSQCLPLHTGDTEGMVLVFVEVVVSMFVYISGMDENIVSFCMCRHGILLLWMGFNVKFKHVLFCTKIS